MKSLPYKGINSERASEFIMSKKSLNKATMVQYINVFIFVLLNSTILCLIANANSMARRNVAKAKGNYPEKLPEDYPNPGPQQEDIEQMVSRRLFISFNILERIC